MVRSVAAVMIGYLVMVLPIVVVFSIYARKYGPQPGRAFIVISLLVGFFAAIGGGATTGLIAQTSIFTHIAALAGLSAVMWLISPSECEPPLLRVTNLLAMVMGIFIGGSLIS